MRISSLYFNLKNMDGEPDVNLSEGINSYYLVDSNGTCGPHDELCHEIPSFH